MLFMLKSLALLLKLCKIDKIYVSYASWSFVLLNDQNTRSVIVAGKMHHVKHILLYPSLKAWKTNKKQSKYYRMYLV